MMSDRAFAELLREALDAYGVTPGEASHGLKSLGLKVDRGTINRWRNGESTPSLAMLEVVRFLPEAIGMSVAEKQTFLRAAGRALGIAMIERHPREKGTPVIPQRIHFGADALPPFAGRHKELSLLQNLVRNRQSVLITGLGGIGKTRLAQEVLRSSAGYFAHGCEYLTLTHGQEIDQIIRIVAQLLGTPLPVGGIPIGDRRPVLATLRDQLRDANLLFLIDNVEHADQVRDLVRELPSITWVITARRASLKSIGVYSLHLGLPPPDDAAAMFMAHAGGAGQWINEEEFVQTINAVSGRLPIAIRLLATMLANGIVTTPIELDAWLQAGGLLGSRLHGGRLIHLFRQLLDAIPPEARALFEVCGVFSTRIIRSASVNEVCRRAGLIPSAILWDSLADFSLIDVLNEEQIQLHPLLHRYARVHLKSSARFEGVEEVYKAYYLALARSVSDARIETQRDYRPLASEEPNLLEVAGLFFRDGDWARLKALWPALSGYLWNMDDHAGYETFDRQCLDAARAMSDVEWEAVILSELGFVAMEKQDWEAAGQLFSDSQAIHDEIPEHVLEQARLRRYRALLAKHQGDLGWALALLDECEARLAVLSNPPETRLGMAQVLLHSAKMSVHFRRGELATAAAAGLAADRYFEELSPDGLHRVGEYKLELGDILYLLGCDVTARDLWLQIIHHRDGMMPLPVHAEAQLRLAWLAGSAGDADEANRLAREARLIFGRYGRATRAAKAESLCSALEKRASLSSFNALLEGCAYPDY